MIFQPLFKVKEQEPRILSQLSEKEVVFITSNKDIDFKKGDIIYTKKIYKNSKILKRKKTPIIRKKDLKLEEELSDSSDEE